MAKKPNILLFFSDQMRGDVIHALGNPYTQTPTMDRLVREGVSFTRCFTPSPVCVSARCSMHYGQYVHSTGCSDNGRRRTTKTPNMFQVLSDNGYRTHGIGKMHFDTDGFANNGFQTRVRQEEGGNPPEVDEYAKYLEDKGYDYIFDPYGQRSEMYYIPQLAQTPARDHPTQFIGDQSIKFLEDWQKDGKDQPFFLMSSYIHPHPPFAIPTPWNKIYRTQQMPTPWTPDEGESLFTFYNRYQNRYKYRGWGVDVNLQRTQKAFYYAAVSFVDYQMGRVMAQLEAMGELDNTLILFSADHGELLGDYNCVGKRTMLDSAARVPMQARLPGVFEAGKIVDAATSLVDIMPTVLDFAGIGRDELPLDGANLQQVADGTEERYIYSQINQENMGLYMIADDTCKYIYSAADDKEYFLDKSADPQESKNLLSEENEAKRAAMKKALTDTLAQNGWEKSVQNGEWQKYPLLEVPVDPNELLLFQDNNAVRTGEGKTLPEGYHASFPSSRYLS